MPSGTRRALCRATSATGWRRLLLTLCVLSLASVTFGRWNAGRAGDPGVSLPTALVGPIAVEPRSPAAHAGLRTGDIVDLRALSSEARYRWLELTVAGERLQVPLRKGGRISIVRIVAAPAPSRPLIFWLAFVGYIWLVLFAAILAWCRSDNSEARVLALVLILEPGIFPLWFEWYTPWVRLDLVANAIGALQLFAFALLATYALLFRFRHDLMRRVLAYTAYAIASLCAVGMLAAEAGFWSGSSSLITLAKPILTTVSPLSPLCLVVFLCLVLTVFGLKGTERSRVGWVTLSLGPTLVLEFVVWGLDGIGHFSQVLENVLDAAIFLAPVGLWISLLNRRLFDIGFAINRAVVFTGVSVVIVGIFVLVEWAFSQWFSSASHTTNLAVSAALALALGLSVRAIHSRVDRVLDAIFFRKRHEDEQAIRTLAREAAYITDPDILLSRMVTVLEEHADASSARVLLDDGAEHYDAISENDPAIVRLRATRAPLDLHDVRSAIAGEFAYPMLARGRLAGALVLGLKRSGEAYAPDESDAIMQLAHDAGAALDVLLTRHDAPHDALETIRSRLDVIVELLRRDEMQPEIVIRGEG